MNPVYKQWFKYDGTAALIIEQMSAGPYEGTTNVKMQDIKTAVAICYSEAVKNAAKKIGPRFGSDLNRTRTPARVKAAKKNQDQIETERIILVINDAETISDLNALLSQLPTQNETIQDAFAKKIISLKKTK